ncbi:hypothetical protein GALMADRAFT_257141 [Galerina marginata CBS 339.88]|uniref:Metallo-beta-lactamase domain-containing protein n=1 Tax=Galerina marginata (strain CBS 339.88) TaxID=685588 RepID=A0A067SEL7_GALM3|nr:hypothetical protein GALMADRAFT_257141 [Galerina marginata CBS 339.88]
MSETVIREVTNGVWTFSKPFARFGVWPMGGRSTAVKLQGGGVWVLASTPLDTETKAKLEELGTVKYIVGADAVHHLFLSDYKNAYPEAKLIAPEAAIARHDDKNLVFDGVWGRDPPDTKCGFEDDIEHCYFSGFKNKDIAFLHKPSKSLIEADLLMNLPAKEQYSKSTPPSTIFKFNVSPSSSWLYPRLLWRLGEDKEAMRKDAKIVSGWDFDRIIPCHGDVIETGGKGAWNAVYKFFLE